MNYRTLKVEKTGQLMTITLNRPQILNALNKQVFLELRDPLAELRANQQINAIPDKYQGQKAYKTRILPLINTFGIQE